MIKMLAITRMAVKLQYTDVSDQCVLALNLHGYMSNY